LRFDKRPVSARLGAATSSLFKGKLEFVGLQGLAMADVTTWLATLPDDAVCDPQIARKLAVLDQHSQVRLPVLELLNGIHTFLRN
jgi:hypothetical protein